MIKELINESYTGYRQLVGTGSVIVLFIAAILTVLIVMRKKQKITPLIISVCGCVAAVAAFVIERICEKIADKRIRYAAAAFAALIFIFVITSSGTNVFSQGQSVAAENDFHIPGYIVESADVILGEKRDARILTMPGWGEYFAAYSSGCDIISPKAEDAASPDEDMRTLYAQLSVVHPDMRKVASIAHRRGCGYVVLADGIWPEVPITDMGYELIFETEGCRLYREVNAP